MAQKVTIKSVSITLTADVSKKLADSETYTKKFWLHLLTAGTGPVYRGDSDMTSANRTNYLPMAVATSSGASDGTYTFTANTKDHGDYFDLNEIYLNSATADTVILEYEAYS